MSRLYLRSKLEIIGRERQGIKELKVPLKTGRISSEVECLPEMHKAPTFYKEA